MLIRTLYDVVGTEFEVEWGNGTSRRLLVARDQLGFSLTETYVRPGSSSKLRYDNHLEACYCVEGSGMVETDEGDFKIEEGTVYAPGKGEQHVLRSERGMKLLCVFLPALHGPERHRLDSDAYSSY